MSDLRPLHICWQTSQTSLDLRHLICPPNPSGITLSAIGDESRRIQGAAPGQGLELPRCETVVFGIPEPSGATHSCRERRASDSNGMAARARAREAEVGCSLSRWARCHYRTLGITAEYSRNAKPETGERFHLDRGSFPAGGAAAPALQLDSTPSQLLIGQGNADTL